jgi:hypothetical protein
VQTADAQYRISARAATSSENSVGSLQLSVPLNSFCTLLVRLFVFFPVVWLSVRGFVGMICMLHITATTIQKTHNKTKSHETEPISLDSAFFRFVANSV